MGKPLRVIEAAYAPAGSDAAWLESVGAIISDSLGAPAGVVAGFIDWTVDGVDTHGWARAAGAAEAVLEFTKGKHDQSRLDPQTREEVARLYSRGSLLCGTRESIPELFLVYTRDQHGAEDARVWPAARPAPRLSLSVVPALERLRPWRVASDEGLVTEVPGTLPAAFDAEGRGTCDLHPHGYCGFGAAASVTRDTNCPELGRVSTQPPPSCQEASRGKSVSPTVGRIEAAETDVCAPSYVRLSAASDAQAGDPKACSSYPRSGSTDVVAVRPLSVARLSQGERDGSTGRLRLVDYRSELGTPLALAHYHDTAQDMPCWIRENERAPGTYACFPSVLPGTIAYLSPGCQGTSLVLVDPTSLAPEPCKALWPTRYFVKTAEDGMTFGEVLESRLVRPGELPTLYRREGESCISVALGDGTRALVTSVRTVRAIPLAATLEAE